MLSQILNRVRQVAERCLASLAKRWQQWTEPMKETVVGGVVNDATRSKQELIA